MFKVPEKSRVKKHQLSQYNSDSSYGNNGCFIVQLSNGVAACIIASDGEGWEHVSIHITDLKLIKRTNPKQERTPTWVEMCKIKDVFWDEEDCVIQFHPPKSEYVNIHKHTLHLWRPTNKNFPTPDSILVGIKDKKMNSNRP